MPLSSQKMKDIQQNNIFRKKKNHHRNAVFILRCCALAKVKRALNSPSKHVIQTFFVHFITCQAMVGRKVIATNM